MERANEKAQPRRASMGCALVENDAQRGRRLQRVLGGCCPGRGATGDAATGVLGDAHDTRDDGGPSPGRRRRIATTLPDESRAPVPLRPWRAAAWHRPHGAPPAVADARPSRATVASSGGLTPGDTTGDIHVPPR